MTTIVIKFSQAKSLDEIKSIQRMYESKLPNPFNWNFFQFCAKIARRRVKDQHAYNTGLQYLSYPSREEESMTNCRCVRTYIEKINLN